MKKVLLLSPLPPPVGGIANWTKILTRIVKTKNDNLILLDTAVRWRNVRKESTFPRIFGGMLQTISVLIRSLKSILLEKPDVMHICTSGSFSFARDMLLIHLARVFGIKTLLHIRMGRLPKLLSSCNKEYKTFYLAFSAADCCLVIDKSSFDAVQLKFVDNEKYAEKIKLLPNFIDLEEINCNKQRVEGNNEYIRLIYIGHVRKTKGIIELFEAIKLLNDPRIRLQVVGPYEKDFKEKLDSIGINDVVDYQGTVEKNRVFELLSASSALILPSYTEGFPNVVVEAMACKKAVLATDVGAIPEMLDIESDNACGMCFKSKSIDEIASCLSTVLQDRKILKTWGENARKRVEEHYSADIVIPKLINIWNNL